MAFATDLAGAVGALFGSESEGAGLSPDMTANFHPRPAPGVEPRVPPPPLMGPTKVDSTIGEMTVVPDDYSGPMPPGAVRESQHEQMVALYDRVAEGDSQLSIDTSNFTDDVSFWTDPFGYLDALGEARRFRAQQLGHLRDLVKTQAGFQTMSTLDSARHRTTITRGDGKSNGAGYADKDAASMQDATTPGAGSDVTITMNPGLTTYANPGQTEQPWMTERQKYGLYHEMVHAYHAVQGRRATGKHKGINNAEWQAMGMGPYNTLPISDNIIRQQMGKEQRPTYGGRTY